MATYLTPDKIRTEYGLTIKEKILPDGNKNKPNRKLTSGSPKYITIHNTDRIVVSSETTFKFYHQYQASLDLKKLMILFLWNY